MRHSRSLTSAVALIALAACLTILDLRAQTRAEEEKQREQWQRVSDIFKAMDVRPGAIVADIGAGDGFFTIRLAGAVGPSGHVYAVDISDKTLDRLRRRFKDEPDRNVTVIKGTSTDPQLPTGSLDAALIVNAYHEMPEHQAILSAVRSALKPNGRLVIVEPISESRRTAARADLARDHEITPELVMQDARQAGLRIIGLEDPFTTRGRDVEWMMTVTPGAARATAVTSSTPATPTEPPSDAWRDPALRISVEDFVTLSTSRGATIIDVRDQGMFAKAHIPEAVLIPLDEIETSLDRLRGLKQPFVTYCS